jgi:hypothetical protein
MYTTIEADIKNGKITGAEAEKLPAHAHVLITLLNSKIDNESSGPVFGCAQGQIVLSADFDQPLDDFSEYMV